MKKMSTHIRKGKLVSLLIAVVMLFTSALTSAASGSISDINKKKADNQAKIKELETLITQLERDATKKKELQEALDKKIAQQNNYISLVMGGLDKMDTQIADKQKEIAISEDKIAEQEQQIQKDLELFKQRLRAMYITGNDSAISALAGSTDFYDILAKMEIMSRLAKYDDELITRLNSKLADQETVKLKLLDQQDELQIKYDELKSKQEEFREVHAQLQKDAEKTTAAIKAIEQAQSESEADIQTYNDMNKQFDKELAAIQAEMKRQEQIRIQQEQQKQPGTTTTPPQGNPTYDGQLKWPVPGFYWVSSPYGSRWGRMHYGIDIAGGGISGASIVAAESGTVIKVYKDCPHNYSKSSSHSCGGGYGNYAVIQHSGGISTLYAHAVTISVSVGDKVNKGQEIGKVGCTGFSTGMHLHFEVITSSGRVNPKNYLNY
jgi:murein DD-endopeptidase MepM/ murein hydrolase activator NlpD